MTNGTEQVQITKKEVLLKIPAMDDVMVLKDIMYKTAGAGELTMDIYYPPGWKRETLLPVVIFVTGYPDLGMQKRLGCKAKEMGSFISWGKLVAVSGMIAITYTNNEPIVDTFDLIRFVREKSLDLGIDRERIGIWSCSGNVPMALFVLEKERENYLKFAVFCYGFMLDLDGETRVAEAAKTFHFVNPCEMRSLDDFPVGLPMFIVRAGQDWFPGILESIDRLMMHAVKRNLPVTFINYPQASHAFDIENDTEDTRRIIRQILSFMRMQFSIQ